MNGTNSVINAVGSLIMFLIVAVIGYIFYIDNNNKMKKDAYENGGYSSYSELSFKDIIEEKKRNMASAVSKYENHIYIFQGKIKRVHETSFTIQYDYKGVGYTFDIYWADSQKGKIVLLNSGDKVKFYGKVDSVNPLFGYCRIEDAIIVD